MTIKINRGGAPKGPRLTKTDKEVLLKIARMGFQSYSELRQDLLKEFSRTHSWSLMKKLVKMGHIAETLGDGGEIRGWYLTPRSVRSLQEIANREGWIMSNRGPTYRSSYRHDLVLREIQTLLESVTTMTRWVPEWKLRCDRMARFFYLSAHEKGEKVATLPDAIFHLKDDDRELKFALEVELRQKSWRRLFKKFESHILSKDYTYIIYVVEGESLLHRLLSIYAEVREKSPHVRFEKKQNGIFFVELTRLRELKENAIFEGIQSKFTLAELAA